MERARTPGSFGVASLHLHTSGIFCTCSVCHMETLVGKVQVQLSGDCFFPMLITQLLFNGFGPQNCFRSSPLQKWKPLLGNTARSSNLKSEKQGLMRESHGLVLRSLGFLTGQMELPLQSAVLTCLHHSLGRLVVVMEVSNFPLNTMSKIICGAWENHTTPL